jgi:hypothetical protein
MCKPSKNPNFAPSNILSLVIDGKGSQRDDAFALQEGAFGEVLV